MANNVKVKNIKVMLEGLEHSLIYDLNAMAEIEDKYGDVDTAFAQLNNKKRVFNTLRFLLWAGMLHEDENLTLYRVGKMINFLDYERVDELTETLNNAIEITDKKNQLKKK